MRVGVKICGVTRADALVAAARGGADAVGFVLAPSPRQLDLASAEELLARTPPGLRRVAVFGAEIPPQTLAAVAALPFDALQADAAACGPAHALGLRVIPVFREGPDVVEELEAYLARHPASALVAFEGPRSGVGRVADWSLAARLARRVPLALAGGLDPDNVAAAIDAVRPALVDVSSGVEAALGVKDPRRVAAFCEAVRACTLEAR